MRSPADFLGLVAYLTLMYGRLPERDMLAAAYADDEDDSDGDDAGQPRPTLWVVSGSEPPDGEAPGIAASADTAAA